MNHSLNYNFNLPEEEDFADIADLTNNWSALDEILNDMAHTEPIEFLFDLRAKSTTIEKVDGNTQVTERDTTDSITSVTTIVKTSDTVTTITQVITPDEGDVKYTKTTTITKSASGTTVSESYTTSPK